MKRPIEIFKEIALIPKCSRDASKMRDHLVGFGESLGFDVELDSAENILCRKGSGQQICMQAHYDMVCIGDVKNIEIVEKEVGVLSAKNSSLGADNCIGVAYMMALMQERDDVEYLFTSDEEIGLVGARELELNLNSRYLINTDTEREEDISIGCAGGFDLLAQLPLEFEKLETNYLYRLSARNFLGGHSGFDIHRGIRNAIKESFYFLKSLKGVKLISINGGEKPNSIPKDTEILFGLDEPLDARYDEEMFLIESIKGEFQAIKNSQKLIDTFVSIPSGVLDFDDEFQVVSDSINLSIVKQKENAIEMVMMGRSNDNATLHRNQMRIETLLKLFGFEKIENSGIFPAWDPVKSEFAQLVRKIFRENLGKGEFRVIHAGFECGVLKSKFPHMEMVSVGPNIYNPHSLSERVEIDSTNRVYEAIKKIIEAV